MNAVRNKTGRRGCVEHMRELDGPLNYRGGYRHVPGRARSWQSSAATVIALFFLFSRVSARLISPLVGYNI